MRPTLLAAALLLPVLGACAPDGPAASARADDAAASASATVTVEIAQSRFSERELVVPAGTTVRFVNLDAPAHTVTASDGGPMPFDSGELLQGDDFVITFDEPGEYAYFCRIHPTMRGVVVVG